MRQSFQAKFNLFFLALALILLAPVQLALAAGSASLQVLGDDPCVAVRECCLKMAACCCRVEPVKPAPASDLACADPLLPTAKFIDAKDSGKLVVPDLLSVGLRPPLLQVVFAKPALAAVFTRPLYILNRSLLL